MFLNALLRCDCFRHYVPLLAPNVNWSNFHQQCQGVRILNCQGKQSKEIHLVLHFCHHEYDPNASCLYHNMEVLERWRFHHILYLGVNFHLNWCQWNLLDKQCFLSLNISLYLNFYLPALLKIKTLKIVIKNVRILKLKIIFENCLVNTIEMK